MSSFENENQKLKKESEILKSQLELILSRKDTSHMFLTAIRENNRIVDFRIDAIGKRALIELQKDESEAIGARLTKLIPEAEEMGLFEKYIEVVETGKGINLESEFVFRGQKFWAYFEIVPWRDGVLVNSQDRTEAKQSEGKLIADLQRLHRFIENVPIGAGSFVGDAVFFNRQTELITGYSREEIKTVDQWFSTLYPGNAEERYKVYLDNKRAAKRGTPVVQITCKDGSKKWVEYSIGSADDMEIWLMRDITESRSAEEKFRVVFENSSAGQILFDDTGILDCNRAALRMIGATHKSQMLKHHPADFSPEFQPNGRSSRELSVEMESKLREGGEHTFEWIHRRLDGSEFPVEVTITHVSLGGKDTILVVWNDISVRIQTEQKLIKYAEDLALAQTIAKIGSFEIGYDPRVLMWTEQAAANFGLPASTPLEEADFKKLVDQETFERIMGAWNGALKSGESIELDYKLKRHDGSEAYLRIMAWPIQDIHGMTKKMVGTIQDITEYKRQHIQLREQEHLLLQASKMSALGEMASGIAHEINNPLAIISGSAERISNIVSGPISEIQLGPLKKSAERIVSTTHRIARIIHSLRDFSRDSAYDPMTKAKVGSVITQALEFCRDRFKNQGIQLEVDVADGSSEILCRSSQIEQVILNLLNNAFDAEVDAIEKGFLAQDRARVVLKSELRGKRVFVTVEDNGRGIPNELSQKIFQPFFTTKPVGKGTGLGLSISERIVRTHGGLISLESQPGKTCFVLSLPAANEVPAHEDLNFI